MRRTASLLTAMMLLAGCYNYEPLRLARVVPSTYVAITLTESGSEELARYVGPSVLVVRGRLLSTTEQGLAVSVAAVETQRGHVVDWQGETVVVPGEFVRALDARHAAPAKTVLLAGASLVGFLAAYRAFGPGASGTTPNGGGGGPASH